VLDNPTYDTVDLYNSLAFEELTESIDGLETGNKEEIIDGAVDEFVIVCGKLQILEAMGYDVAEAIKRVCDNNLSKFPSLDAGCAYNKEFELSVNEKYNVYVIRDKNGKIRKPEGFVSVDLSDCVPKGGDA
jgi:hypothetical protein